MHPKSYVPIPCGRADSHMLICSEPVSCAWDEVWEVHPELAHCAQEGQGHKGIPAVLLSSNTCTHFQSRNWHRTYMSLVSCDKNIQWAQVQHWHYFRHSEIKKCIIQVLSTQGQTCQLNAHLLITEETWEGISWSAPPTQQARTAFHSRDTQGILHLNVNLGTRYTWIWQSCVDGSIQGRQKQPCKVEGLGNKTAQRKNKEEEVLEKTATCKDAWNCEQRAVSSDRYVMFHLSC